MEKVKKRKSSIPINYMDMVSQALSTLTSDLKQFGINEKFRNNPKHLDTLQKLTDFNNKNFKNADRKGN